MMACDDDHFSKSNTPPRFFGLHRPAGSPRQLPIMDDLSEFLDPAEVGLQSPPGAPGPFGSLALGDLSNAEMVRLQRVSDLILRDRAICRRYDQLRPALGWEAARETGSHVGAESQAFQVHFRSPI